ncbi:MAG TPA: DUF883 family protein [Candidatus Sulfotelmatobacter sp.]|nr:DUF883 family protein [Candidatus Sulfotelmatobacter sp.]
MQKLVQDFKAVLQDAEGLAKATAGDLGEKVRDARARLTTSLESAKESYRKAEEKTVEGAKVADKYIRDHPYQSVGVAFGVGILLGVLVSRK